MANTIRIKRGLKENLPILQRGEIAYATDTNELFIGILGNPTNAIDNVLINSLDFLQQYYTKSQIVDLSGEGIIWNTQTDQFDIINPFNPQGTYPDLRAQSTTKDDVGLGDVANFPIANQQESALGATDERYMTPLRTLQAIEALSSTVFIEETAPGNPKEGDLWWDEINSILYMRIDAAWVAISFGPEAVTKSDVLTLDNTTAYIPTSDFHPSTKAYVDQVAQGIKTRTSAFVLVDFNLDATYDDQPELHELTANNDEEFPTVDDIDSSVLNVEGARLLLAGQTNAEENGLYVVKTAGVDGVSPWVIRRCTQCDTSEKIPGSYIFVTKGTLYENTGWILDVDTPSTFVLGVDNINVVQFSGVGTFTAGDGLDLDGPEFSVDSTVLRSAPGYADTEAIIDELLNKADRVANILTKTESFTVGEVDSGKVVVMNNGATNVTITIPEDSVDELPIGTQVAFIRNGTGTVTLASAAAILSEGNKKSIKAQYTSVAIVKIADDTWQLVGNLAD